MDDGSAVTMIGTNVGAVSIVIVYHMFALESWHGSFKVIRDEAAVVARTTTPDSYLRDRSRLSLRSQLARFPWMQVTILGVAVALMVVTGIITTSLTTTINHWLLQSPLLVLALVYISSTLTVFLKGLKLRKDGIGDLG